MHKFLVVLALAGAVGLAPVPKGRRWRLACGLFLGLLVCGLAVPKRIHWLATNLRGPFPTSEVESVALCLVHGKGFGNSFGPDTGPTTHVTPLYPLFLAGQYWLAGGADPITIRLIQGLLSIGAFTVALLLLPALARNLGLPSRTGWAAALVLATQAGADWSEVSGNQESSWIALSLVLVTAVLGRLHRQGWRRRWAIGTASLLLGIVALFNPVVLLGAGLQLLGYLASSRGQRSRILVAVAAMTAIASLVCLPWVVRNAVVFGRFIPLRGNLGLELLIGNNDQSDGRTYHPGFGTLHPWGNPKECVRLAALGEPAYMDEKQNQALRWIANHPERFAHLTLQRAWLFFFAPPELRHIPWSNGDHFAQVHISLAILALLGLGWLAIRQPRAAVTLTAAILGFCLPYLLTHVNLRYRVPLPFLLVLPAMFLVLTGLKGLWLSVRQVRAVKSLRTRLVGRGHAAPSGLVFAARLRKPLRMVQKGGQRTIAFLRNAIVR